MSQTLWRRLGSLIAAVLSLSSLTQPAQAFATGDAVTYSKSFTAPANPAANFTGSSGLDTWGINVDDGKVYGIVHVDAWSNPYKLRITCNFTSDGSACPNYPLTIADYATTTWDPLAYLDPTTHHLYTIVHGAAADDAVTMYGICIDLTNTANPVCGTTQLGSMKAWSNAFVYASGQKLISVAFNDTPGLHLSDTNIFCYDSATGAACPSQPYKFASGTLTNDGSVDGPPHSGLVAGTSKVLAAFGGKLVCFDLETVAACAGSWPLTTGFGYFSGKNFNGQTTNIFDSDFTRFLPYIEAESTTGFCFVRATNQTWNCRKFDGTFVNAPTHLADLYPPVYTTNCVDYTRGGDPVTDCMPEQTLSTYIEKFGSRIYFPFITDIDYAYVAAYSTEVSTGIGELRCFDYSTGDACAGFSRALTDMYFPYITYTDPANPSCMWANGDSGDGQMQNFDAYTGGACGATGSRVLFSSYIEPGATCAPSSYGTLTINSPLDYTTATASFVDANGAALTGLSGKTFNASHSLNLANLGLPKTAGALPQMLIELKDANGDLINSAIDMTMSWNGTYDATCVANGQTAAAAPSGPSITSDDSATVETGVLNVLDVTSDLTSPTWSIDGGANAALFTIDASGHLKFRTAQPVGDYVVVVKAVKGSDTLTQTVTIHVGDTTDPSFTLAPTVNVQTGTSATIVTPSNASESGTYTLSGADADLFEIDPSTGAITLRDPNQALGDYNVTVTLTDDSGNSVSHSTVISVVAHIEVGNPGPATRTDVAGGKTRVNWTAATNATQYQVKLGTKVLCTTVNTSCVIPKRYAASQNLFVFATASNGDVESTLAEFQESASAAGELTKKVWFASGSAKLNKLACKRLRALVAQLPKNAKSVNIIVTGWVQLTPGHENDHSLSKARAKNVRWFIRTLTDIKIDSFITRGKGVSGPTDRARYAQVVIKFTQP